MNDLARRNEDDLIPFAPEIDKALLDGNRLHSFSSGGGLRVVRIESPIEGLVGYGEAPQIEEAIGHAALNYQLRESYEEQYSGKNARYVHYLTGTPEPSSPLDAHIRQGHICDAYCRDGKIVVALSGLDHVPDIPRELHDRVTATGRPATWEERGVEYEVSRKQFADREYGTATSVVSNPEGVDPWMFRYTQTGEAETFAEAVQEAFEAPQIEFMPDSKRKTQTELQRELES